MDDEDGFDLAGLLESNASISYTTLQFSGPPSRPLELPSPTLGRGITVSADIIDHRSGNSFRSKILMRRPIHSKSCACVGRTPPSASLDATNTLGHRRTTSEDKIHDSWHPFTNSLTPPKKKPPQHRRVHSHSSNMRCDSSCDWPEKACKLQEIHSSVTEYP